MDKYDPSTITEFPRFEPEATQSGVTTFFNKLLKPLFSAAETPANYENQSSGDNKQENNNIVDKNLQETEECNAETASYAVEIEGRSLPNVLRRISSLVASGSGGGTRYEDTELARYWMPDDISRECYECAARFSTLRRRHHCRVCGQIFCSRCCSQRIPGQIFGCAGGLRVCNYCCNVVLSYLRENDMAGDISPDLRTLQENLKSKFPESRHQQDSGDNFVFGHEPRDDCDVTPTRSKEDLDGFYRQLYFTLPTQTHRYRLVRYSGVWRGSDILQYVINNSDNKTRSQASLVCQNLVSEGYVESCVDVASFADYAVYRPVVTPASAGEDTPESRVGMSESTSSYRLDLNLDESSARVVRDRRNCSDSSTAHTDHSPIDPPAAGGSEEGVVEPAIYESGEEHLKLLCRQCLARNSLSTGWEDVLYPLCRQAADLINLDMMCSEIDVREYVQVKKVPGGGLADSRVVNGCAITKNVAHRAMPQRVSNAAILLLDCSIAYHRVEGKLTSLEPVLMQEQEYLTRCAARISALRPNVVIVKGSVSRTVQELLLKEKICVVSGVGGAYLRRAGRVTATVPVTGLDARLHSPALGQAGLFYVHNFGSKTLMILENCANPHLGCCILLRGASEQELVKAKKVAKFITLACYNWKLERALLTNFQARLPEPGMKFITETTDETEPYVEKCQSDSCQASTTDSVESEEKLDSVKRFKKSDSDKLLSCGVPIRDFSDPLRARQSSVDDDKFLNKEDDVFRVDTQTERWSTDDVVLCMSPNTIIPPPYLETEAGRKSAVRRYFHSPLLQRPPSESVTPRTRRRVSRLNDQPVTMEEFHPFIMNPITSSADDPGFRSSLAHYRATGCRLVYSEHKVGCPSYNPSVLKRASTKESATEDCERNKDVQLDPFDPENHQKLSLLIYSYSRKSPNVPDFCVNPWIATMDMYGKHDITLGAFLERYCFNAEYKCPSANCQIPMNQHDRKFVHGDVCITITCNTIGHSHTSNTEPQNQQMVWWSRCGTCGACGPRRAVSARVSLGVYLRGRVLPVTYITHCPHPLNTHDHMFHKNHTTACFKYEKISTWEIDLPPDLIVTNYDTKAMRDSLINQLNELVLKGHELFSSISESEAEKDHVSFKQHMDQIHLALTSTALQEHTTLTGVVRSLWSVSDHILVGEKLLRDAQDKWTTPANKNKTTQENVVEDKSDLEDAADSSNDNSDTPRDETDKGGEEDEEKGDKKTVRQIILQLLSTNHPSNQSGIVITSGAVPVVLAGEVGSVVAATLASHAYLRTLHKTTSVRSESNSTQSEHEDGDVTQKDKPETDKNKAIKSSEHIEVVLKDGLLCRVYYARQFYRLRHLLLAPVSGADSGQTSCDRCNTDDKGGERALCEIEEGFIRSLAHCVPWAAKGGKSGSTFCKTKDDRYVLKEMTKPEWQQFLEFAPHYFNYVITCHQNKYPTLLGRILGVFGVGGAGSGVLVMENLVYARDGLNATFDLKGASRHRLSTDSVLLDQDLLNRRWKAPLFVQSDRARVVFAAVGRDTSFLAHHSVMDYSLLLGLHQQTLVLGVIDYIRTFTWDKKLEHYVKKNLGSGQPTVVSPHQYKQRFHTAMLKYFLHAPAHWDHLTRGLVHPPHHT